MVDPDDSVTVIDDDSDDSPDVADGDRTDLYVDPPGGSD